VPGPAIVALGICDPPERWAALGFTVAHASSQVGATELRFGEPGEGGIANWTLTGPDRGDLDGIPTSYADAAGTATDHPNTAVAVDHVVLASPDIDRTFARLQAAGMTLRRERTAEGGHRQGFFRHGEAILEVVGPSVPDPAGRSHLYGLTVTVADLDACAQLLGGRLGPVHDAVQPGRQIASLRREAGVRVPLAFMSVKPPTGAPR
jgi:hypothetical protein